MNCVRHTAIALVVWVAMVGAAEPQRLTVEERLQRLEDEVRSLRQENQELRQQLAVDGKSTGPVVRPAGKESALNLGGLLQVQGEFGDKGDSRFKTANDRFHLRRARVNAAGRFQEDFDFRVELELAGTLTDTAALRAQMTDGFINWNRYPWANIKVGQFKTPFGYEQLASDPKLFTIERSLVNDVLTLGREVGAQVGGTFFDQRVSYAAGAFNGTPLNFNYNDDDRFSVVQRLAFVPWRGTDGYVQFGGNYYFSNDRAVTNMSAELGLTQKQFAGYRQGGGVDAQVRYGPFDLWAEYLRAEFRPHDDKPANRFEADGWYVMAGWFFVPKQWQAVVRYETFDPRVNASDDTTATWTFGVNWYLKGDDLKLQLNYLLTDLAGDATRQSKVLLRLQSVF